MLLACLLSMEQSDFPPSDVNLEQIMDAPIDEGVGTRVESARDEAVNEPESCGRS